MKQISFILLAGFLIVGCLLGQSLYHEQAHVQIFSYAGVPSHIEYTLVGGVVIPEAEFATPQLKEQAYIGHGFNESVAYNVVPLALMICGVMILCTFYLKGEK